MTTQLAAPPPQSTTAGVHLHRALADLLGARENHTSSALRALAELRRAPDGRFDGGPASMRLLWLLGGSAPTVEAVAEARRINPARAEVIVQSELDDLMLTAWLVATHRSAVAAGREGRGGFGSDLRVLQPAPRATDHAEGPTPLDRRMQRLISTPREDLARELRHLFALLAKGAPNHAPGKVDVSAFVRDLAWWDHPERIVQRRWAYQFWVSRPRTSTDADPSAGDASGAPATSDDPKEDR
jgi:CRISPR type I-E-associated protein CasB/Cse2